MPSLEDPAPSPYDPFVPRAGRLMALAAGVAGLLLFCVLAALVPGGPRGFGVMDRLLLVGCGLGIALLLARYAAIRADPSEEGLRVRNLFAARDIPWGDIEQVRFGHGDPWVRVLLHDTEEVAVMAIQRADGLGSRSEAARLTALVQAHQGRGDVP
ncbi:PH domain-containing protein [Arsenicicoccus dermatophilus]|uniref:PH domain-containing protein n=1 Tax=Arsenicicoccus dermatophilus TaxID=1076331 RepID=UPI003916EBF3